jgi:hypothetical protein
MLRMHPTATRSRGDALCNGEDAHWLKERSYADSTTSFSVIVMSSEYFRKTETRRAASRIDSFKFGGRLNRLPLAKHCPREGDRCLSIRGLPSLPSICLP